MHQQDDENHPGVNEQFEQVRGSGIDTSQIEVLLKSFEEDLNAPSQSGCA